MSGPPSTFDLDGNVDASLGYIKSKSQQVGYDASNTTGTSGSVKYDSSITKIGVNSNIVNSIFASIQLDTTSTIKWDLHVDCTSAADNEFSCTSAIISKPKTGGVWRILNLRQSTTDPTKIVPPTLGLNVGLGRVEFTQPAAAISDGVVHHSISYRFVCQDAVSVAEPSFV